MPQKSPRHTNLDPKLQEMLETITAATGEPDGDALVRQESAAHLQTLYARLTNGQERALRPGMLAVWKRGLKNRRFPAYGVPAVVIEVREHPLIDNEKESGLTYFQEPLDLLLGILWEDDSFLVFHFDSRRFEPYEGGENPAR